MRVFAVLVTVLVAGKKLKSKANFGHEDKPNDPLGGPCEANEFSRYEPSCVPKGRFL